MSRSPRWTDRRINTVNAASDATAPTSIDNGTHPPHISSSSALHPAPPGPSPSQSGHPPPSTTQPFRRTAPHPPTVLLSTHPPPRAHTVSLRPAMPPVSRQARSLRLVSTPPVSAAPPPRPPLPPPTCALELARRSIELEGELGADAKLGRQKWPGAYTLPSFPAFPCLSSHPLPRPLPVHDARTEFCEESSIVPVTPPPPRAAAAVEHGRSVSFDAFTACSSLHAQRAFSGGFPTPRAHTPLLPSSPSLLSSPHCTPLYTATYHLAPASHTPDNGCLRDSGERRDLVVRRGPLSGKQKAPRRS
ncbi:hypothetical protein C8F04DRAFT_1332629 [Mycena alexandri]|uniref:Uncharacterized protein n=1 Tax=Mycena alexandri TaxID=1745969 RepID=A0AAD6X2Y9_9AGAR|nr:hypothetical protein C8F04DRAFT_1332629 [Mycena alexandri]